MEVSFFVESNHINDINHQHWDKGNIKNYGKTDGKDPPFFLMGKLTISTGPFSIVYPLVMTNSSPWYRWP